MTREPQKYEIHTTEYDLYVNGVKQKPCDPSVIAGKPQPEPSTSHGMRYNLVSLMREGADTLREVGDHGGQAYALHEAANNMIELLNGEATLAELKSIYTAGTAKPLDLDELFPDVDEEGEEAAN